MDRAAGFGPADQGSNPCGLTDFYLILETETRFMRLLVVGNIVKNLIIRADKGESEKDGKMVFGGSSYSAVGASALTTDTYLLSRGNLEEEGYSGWVGALKRKGITVHMQDDDCLVTSLTYYADKDRVERIIKKPEKKIEYTVNDKFDVIHFNPIFQEIDLDVIQKARKNCKVLSLDVQGLVRKESDKTFVARFWEERDKFLPYIDFLKVGRNEIPLVSKEGDFKKVCEELRSLGAKVVALTFRTDGSLVYDGEFFEIPIFKTKTVDKTGSGDVYGVSFAFRYFETNNALDAGLFATAAASFVVEDYGPESIAPREKVEERCEILKEKIL